MILHTEEVDNDTYVQIANGIDIIHTYTDNRIVSSCMSKKAGALKFYLYVKDLSIFRIIHHDIVIGRALIWKAKDVETDELVTMIDKLYSQRKISNYRDDAAKKIFKATWKQFADIRTTNKKLYVDVLRSRFGLYPYVDTFRYANTCMSKLYNTSTPKEVKYQLSGLMGCRERIS